MALMPLILLNHTNALKVRLTSSYVAQIAEIQTSMGLPKTEGSHAVSKLIVGYFAAHDSNDGEGVADCLSKLYQLFLKRLDKHKSTPEPQVGSPPDYSFEFLIFLLESLAFELNVVKPDHKKVALGD